MLHYDRYGLKLKQFFLYQFDRMEPVFVQLILTKKILFLKTELTDLRMWSVFATENVNQLNVDDDKNKNRIVVATNLHIAYVFYTLSVYGDKKGATKLCMYCWRCVVFLLIFVFVTHTLHRHLCMFPTIISELHSLVL